MTTLDDFENNLKGRLSETARIVGCNGTVLRWDGSCAPNPSVTVFPQCESDVAETVKLCRQKGIKCFAQGGGHGWRVRNNREIDVVICLREMNSVTVNERSRKITFGGGAIVKELIEAATAKKMEITTGVCNSVGVMGSTLCGGIGRYMGKYGLAIDNLLSVNFVDAAGKLHRGVSQDTDEDLWWAIRGAGTSFGIITEATMQAHLQSNNGLSWTGALIFADSSKLEAVVEAINGLEMDENMCVHFLIACFPPTHAPAVMVVPWYYGPEEKGEKAWKSLLDIGPTTKQTFMAPANRLNDGNDPFGEMGGRKPGVGLGLDTLDPKAYRHIWDLYVQFISENPDAARTVIVAERYPKAKASSVDRDTAAFAHRDSQYEVICVPWYTDEKLDIRADAFAQTIRNIWIQKCCKPGNTHSYVAFSGLNEPLESLFGERERVDKLMQIKRKWDPENYWGALMDIM
ncbi:hypothetical protein TWF102_003324 [Orbilia oligospora]|uniref:FAD-binding PCMH-type domain-containing protein n=1 Tax=Orbilia oligospora TaxID=2813651 RepID=A0A7C8IZG8_ORBOL|nr:hypothetical protein TWF102_003324 [Orbilia oligospora]KAF3113200.1 hypothetical protein TWF103_002375 [Orbilia oligospora]KAF3147516.1 hypothetical protein TWF594_002728 [Orbilia oligospora]